METSYEKYSDEEWDRIRHIWAKGCDWFIHKTGKKWGVHPDLDAGWPLFKTKTEAYNTVTELFLQECHNRMVIKAKIPLQWPKQQELRK